MAGPPPRLEETLADLRDAFPRQKVSVDTFRVYLRNLADVPPGLLSEAAVVLTRSSEFFPTIAAIRETVAEIALDLPSEAEALSQVARRVEWGRSSEDLDPATAPDVHPLVLETVQRVGGFFAFRTADEPGVVRGQFGRLYRAERTAALRGCQVGEIDRVPEVVRAGVAAIGR